MKKIFLSMLLCLGLATSVAQAQESDYSADMFAVFLMGDVDKHIFYIRLVESDELSELLVRSLRTKIFDLNHYLAEARTQSTIDHGCRIVQKVRDELQEIIEKEKSTGTPELITVLYQNARICVAKTLPIVD